MTGPVGIALGSNQGDRVAEIEAGIAFLGTLSIHGILRQSALIETAPIDCPPGSAPFLNVVVEIEVDPVLFPPDVLLSHLQQFEILRGRPREREINAPRPLDLDIIYFGSDVIAMPGLIIPHPRAHERRFVLEPLSQIRPDLILPGQNLTVQQLRDSLPDGTLPA